MFIIFSVFYILVAAAMTVLILMQRGEGANAGASFGGGSSGTVFGARGSASFMGRATYVLFALFIIMSLGMAIYLSHTGAPKPVSDLGVMSGVGATTAPAKTDKNTTKPATQSPASEIPQATVPAGAGKDSKPTASESAVPKATANENQAGKAASDKDGTPSGSDKNQH
ncbi:MAG TPA: preprotein translocase subunit SecG [Oleiagrimonas sp.]|nr:preprotein translocase subunit SecG [Oleiagrimonas sp.]